LRRATGAHRLELLLWISDSTGNPHRPAGNDVAGRLRDRCR